MKKKILLLGGSHYLLPVIRAAKDLGLHTITCDYLPDNAAHKFSDEYHNVSIIEKEEVLALAQELKIDGVISFACDPGVATAAYVAEKMGLPAAGPYESVAILQDKSRFRAFLRDNGFRVPKAQGFSSPEEALEKAADFDYPVVVKPVDSAGSKGVSRVDGPEGLQAGIDNALAFSHCNRFIIEDFIQQKGFASDTECFSLGGKLVFASFNDQHFDRSADNPYTPAAFTWPSTMEQRHQEELRRELQRLMELLHMDSSVYNVETRVGMDDVPYIMEVSPRGGGNRLCEMLRYASGTDLIAAAVKAAVGLPVGELSDPVYKGNWAEVILHSKQTGAFRRLDITPDVRPYVVEEQLWVKDGDLVESFSGANKTIGTLVLNFPSREELEKRMADLDGWLQVVVE